MYCNKPLTCSCLSTVSGYDRILSIEHLSDVPNPWKGFTMNRCLVLALVVLLLSSGVSELHDAMDYFVEETGIRSFVGSLQDGSIFQISLWDNFMGWWGTEELGAIRRRKKPIGNKSILKPKPKVWFEKINVINFHNSMFPNWEHKSSSLYSTLHLIK